MSKVLVDEEQLKQLMDLCEAQQKRLDEFDNIEVIEISLPTSVSDESEIEADENGIELSSLSKDL